MLSIASCLPCQLLCLSTQYVPTIIDDNARETSFWHTIVRSLLWAYVSLLARWIGTWLSMVGVFKACKDFTSENLSCANVVECHFLSFFLLNKNHDIWNLANIWRLTFFWLWIQLLLGYHRSSVFVITWAGTFFFFYFLFVCLIIFCKVIPSVGCLFKLICI